MKSFLRIQDSSRIGGIHANGGKPNGKTILLDYSPWILAIKGFPPSPYCYFCVIPPRVSAVSTFNQLSSCYLRSTERRFTSRTFLFKLRYRGLQGITGREELHVFLFFSFFFFCFARCNKVTRDREGNTISRR